MPSDDDGRKREAFYALIQRYNALGCLLPEPDQMDGADVASVKLVLCEMEKTKAAIDALLSEAAA
jgi:hypothetical protein